jgi:NAD(P)-dependent dehydrogenase (short-subunit alcohol dehydrogenase family)
MQESNVVITGAGRDLGRALAILFAERGDRVFLSARSQSNAERTRDELLARGHTEVYAFPCDLSKPKTIRDFAAMVSERAPCVDILVNNAAGWLEGSNLSDAQDDAIVSAVTSTVAGTVLVVKHFLPMLLASERPDIINMISAAGLTGVYKSESAHSAYYAAKSGQSGFVHDLSRRLRPKNVRVISLYPPDFDNLDPLSPSWRSASRAATDRLTSISVTDCIMFAINQPRDCFINAFHFSPEALSD